MIFRQQHRWVWLLFSAWFLLALSGIFNLLSRPGIPMAVRKRDPKTGLILVNRNGQVLHVVQADGIPVKTAADLEFVVEGGAIGTPLRLQTRQGETVRLQRIRRHPISDVLVHFLTGFFFAVLGLIVGRRRTGSAESRFVLAAFSFGLIICFNWLGVGHPVLGWPTYIAFSLTYPLAFVALVFFGLRFPESGLPAKLTITVQRIMLLLGSAFALGLLVLGIWRMTAPGPRSFSSYMILFRTFRAFLLLSVLLAMASIFMNGRLRSDRVSRIKLYWVMAGIAVGSFPFLFLWNAPQMLGFGPLVPGLLADLFLLAIPLSVAVAILRYRLFDIEFFLSRSLAYGFSLALLIGLYIAVTGSISFIASEALVSRSAFLSTAAAVVAALFFAPVKARVQEAVDRRFFRIRLDRFQTLQRFLDRTEQVTSAREILRELGHCLQKHIPLEMNFFLNPQTEEILPVQNPRDFAAELRPVLQENFSGNRKIILNRSATSSFESAAGWPAEDLPSPVAIAVVLHGNWVWLLGKKRAGLRYWLEDLQLIEKMSQAANVSLQKLEFVEKAYREEEEKRLARRISQWKSLLVAQVAHNFRSPLNALLWQVKCAPEETHHRLAGVESQIRLLQNRVESLLNLSALEQGRLHIHWQDLPVSEVVNSAVAILAFMARQKDVQLEVRGAPDHTIYADRVLAEEILQNILENAIRHSPDQGTIWISWQNVWADRTRRVCLSVRDEGPGIPEEERKLLFEPFSGIGPERPGKGRLHLGLHMAREFIRRLDGDLEVVTPLQGGTEIKLFFRAGRSLPDRNHERHNQKEE